MLKIDLDLILEAPAEKTQGIRLCYYYPSRHPQNQENSV